MLNKWRPWILAHGQSQRQCECQCQRHCQCQCQCNVNVNVDIGIGIHILINIGIGIDNDIGIDIDIAIDINIKNDIMSNICFPKEIQCLWCHMLVFLRKCNDYYANCLFSKGNTMVFSCLESRMLQNTRNN